MKNKDIDFQSFVGKTVNFYGVDCSTLCIGLRHPKRYAFEAVEDESDGWRSMMEELRQVPIKGHIFFRKPIARVKVEEHPELDGYRLRDVKTDHVWLEMGTDHSDEWYPCFVFRYAIQTQQ